MTGNDIKSKRELIGLSQAKLSSLAKIEQAKLSAFELGKSRLSTYEINSIATVINNITTEDIESLKKKKYVKTSPETVNVEFPRKGYTKTERNGEYLNKLRDLETSFLSPKTNDLKAMSFFAGCGGLCYGAQAAGFNIVATNELEESYKDIYRLNFPKASFLPNDIRDITEEDIDKVLRQHKQIDLMIGGPPCQGFSLAGKRDVNDRRNNLFEYYLKIANQVKPKVVLLENVKLLTSMKDPNGKLVKQRILDMFQKIGYVCSFFFVNAKDYGVPQHRERVIFIAVRKDINKDPSIPAPSYGQSTNLFVNNLPFFTFGDGVSDLDYLESGDHSANDKLHWAVKHPKHVIQWLINVPEGKSAHDNEDPALRPTSGYNTTYKRQVWAEPAGTVATTYGMISGCRNVHPIATRALTTREALRLQSFPDSFRLTGNNGIVRTVIGNAVPPLLGFALVEHMRDNYIL